MPFDDAQAGGGGAVAREERQLAMLDRLAEAGLNIVLAIERQAMQAPVSAAPPVFLGDLALSYSRAARAVRMTIALHSRLVGEHHKQVVEARAQFRVDELRYAAPRKARIGRIVERVAWAEHDDDETVDRLVIEASERLEDSDLYGDVMTRPFSEIIDRICRDLDLTPDWPDLAQEAWAREEIAGGAVGAPLAGFAPRRSSPPRSSRGHATGSGSSVIEESALITAGRPRSLTTAMGPGWRRPSGRNGCEGGLITPTSPPP